MDLVTPGIGLVFWTTLVFVLLAFLLAKFAWKPILSAIKEREENIDKAIKSAELAREELKSLQASNERILNEARAERDGILKDAREAKESIIAEAKSAATKESERIMAQAHAAIQNEKMAAITDLKNQVATLSVEIAEKIIKEHLSSDDKQKALIKNLMQEVNLN